MEIQQKVKEQRVEYVSLYSLNIGTEKINKFIEAGWNIQQLCHISYNNNPNVLILMERIVWVTPKVKEDGNPE